MPNTSKLRMYGENAATFLIFQAIAVTPGATEKVLLRNLKRFGSRRTLKQRQVTKSEIWLFPSFGKGHGFGEPDALVIADEDVFWIEVETSIDCQRALPLLRQSLRQLWRFRHLQAALARGPRHVGGTKRIVGMTVGKDGRPRRASIKLAGHGVLKELLRPLGEAGRHNRDHYVLFTVDKPKGPGGTMSYGAKLSSEARDLESSATELAHFPLDRCWYAYWKGDIDGKFENHAGLEFDLDDQYVRIKRRQAARRRSPRGTDGRTPAEGRP